MLIYPAIDLLDGACVRLEQGDYDRVTRFSDDPVETARRFVRSGAPALHVVDLDGAREGRPVHRELVLAISASVDVPVQVGGGLRSEEDVAACLESGVHRAILGTAAARDPGWLARLLERWGADRIAAGVDVAGEEVRVEGWRQGALRVEAFLDFLAEIGAERIVYTDTVRDGTLTGPDVEGAARVIRRGFRTIVAGGVSTRRQLERLRDIGADGAVVGSALYRGELDLAAALAAASGGDEENDAG